jgi:hypothetical protein
LRLNVVIANPKEGLSRAAFWSWWPSAATWANSGMVLDYWSPDNERWFVRHCKAIRDRRFQPRSAAEWRQALAQKNTARTNIIINTVQLSADAIDRMSKQIVQV